MTTRAEKIAGEGPYTVRYDNGRYVLDGPTPTVGFWALEEWDAQNHADDLNAAYKQGQQDRWISVRDHVPEDDRRVLVTDGGNVIETRHNGNGFKMPLPFPAGLLVDVTHWCELPSPPNPNSDEHRQGKEGH